MVLYKVVFIYILSPTIAIHFRVPLRILFYMKMVPKRIFVKFGNTKGSDYFVKKWLCQFFLYVIIEFVLSALNLIYLACVGDYTKKYTL